MKELSIEEKAKRYDEAIEKANSLWHYKNQPCIINVSEIFPELEKNEDEEIRQWLIGYFQEYKSTGIEGFANGLKIDTIIDWLEKQGEQKYNTDFSDLRTWKYIVDAVLTEKEGIGQYLDSPVTEEVAKKLQKRFGNIA